MVIYSHKVIFSAFQRMPAGKGRDQPGPFKISYSFYKQEIQNDPDGEFRD